jgi:glycosyltransferase involved in cell wall biosynthesis
MRLLILTQYYSPEIGAPQNRLHELAVRLNSMNIDVEILTALPNYPKMEIMNGYKKKKNREEIIDGITIHRSWIYVSKSKSIIARLLNYFSFVWSSYWRGIKLEQFDYLMVESPPLFLGYSAMALSKKLRAKLIFNVSDLWPESAEKLEIVTNKRLLKFAYNLESKCYRKATLITGQTQGIVNDIKTRFPAKDVFWLPNGVDVNFYNPDQIEAGKFRLNNGFKESDLLLFYGGILGYAQGLEVILNAANILKTEKSIQFIIQGSGPEKVKLLALKNELKLENVHFLNPVPKNEMPSVLKSIDIALVPLKKLELFQGAIPSKVFEALAMKKPLLLGVDGEARKHFIEKGLAGLYFEPENEVSLAKSILHLSENRNELHEMSENARDYVSKHFNRNQIANAFHDKLKQLFF